MAFKSLRGREFGYDPASGQVLVNGAPIGMGALALGRGKTFYVDSNVAAGEGTSPATAVATIALAYALCTASQGDTIVVMPGHAEAISHASTSLSCTKAGIRIIGLGEGDARPTITLNTANTASIAVSAASNSFENIIFVANFLSIAACFTLSTAKAFTLRNCLFRETSGVLNFLNIVKSTGAANTVDRLTLINNTWRGLGTTSVNSFVLTANDIDGLTLLDNRVMLARTATAAALVTVSAGVLTNLDCGYNRTYTQQTATTGGGLINVGGTTSTGMVYENYQQTLGAATDILFTVTVGLGAFENRVSGAVGATGFVIPAVDS